MKALFLGAGKRLTLLERFIEAAQAEDVKLDLFSVEKNNRVPIASVASIITGPRFNDPSFIPFLLDVIGKYKFDFVIPNFDSATVALSHAKKELEKLGTWAVVSDNTLCKAMEDKIQSDQWFIEHDIQVPSNDRFPKIIKNRLGYGARDQFIASNQTDLEQFLNGRNPEDYIIQSFVSGQEYSVDAYVDRSGKVISALSRKRLEVSAGEVETSETYAHPEILKSTYQILSKPGWQGPITLQFIDDPSGPVIIEINPRFGGGVTHSIHCGLDMPRWIIRENLNRPLGDGPQWKNGSIMTRCRRDIFL